MSRALGLLERIRTPGGLRRTHAAEFPPAPFIVGVPRSGTTLLRMMCDAHTELSIPPEMGFLPAVAVLRGRGDGLRRAFAEALTRMPSWADAHIAASAFERALAEAEPFNVAAGVRTFYRAYAARFGKKRWGDKTPFYCLHMDKIEKVLPEARFIHIIRDGRDVALSQRGLWFAPGDGMEALAHQWRTWITTARRLGRRRRHYMEVRYEELVADAPRVLREVCDFVGLDYDVRMEKYYESSAGRLGEVNSMYREDGTLLISKEERLYNQRFAAAPPEPSRVFRWRAEMDADSRSRYAAVAGDLLEELGYQHV